MTTNQINNLKNEYVGKTIKIIFMEGEPRYTGKVGVCRSVDDIGQLHGSWGGCAIIPDEDVFQVV